MIRMFACSTINCKYFKTNVLNNMLSLFKPSRYSLAVLSQCFPPCWTASPFTITSVIKRIPCVAEKYPQLKIHYRFSSHFHCTFEVCFPAIFRVHICRVCASEDLLCVKPGTCAAHARSLPLYNKFFFVNSAGISFTSNAQRWKDISATAPTPSLLVSSIIVAPIEDSAFFFVKTAALKTMNFSLRLMFRYQLFTEM